MENSKDCAIAEPNIKPYFNIRSIQCFITSQQNELTNSLLLHMARQNKCIVLNGVTSSDNISVLVNTMACLGYLGETTHATIDFK